ncbi:protein kinase domain protein [Ichthyophthirius multifiliis]|uniref:non-specific serine/threonine protein kinase n=1 Tax=Ichthyophthirius multifiliis TaxID=5932 RepID=G0QU87_ICHMU|nr:protein kinase domain protein [Ichthyophthirius multifiliis]EGR31224.1 protein kinase domain protein [Ichthyophthirius multifiliis]|eukprot:XP_004034710.1 protein kinase domain protein [Ichthyophthirius multifiliis]
MEYCEEGDLSFHIKQQAKENIFFSEKIILNWFVQITLALDYIHEKNILHRDLKSSNVFLTRTGCVKIGDFGISRILFDPQEKVKTMIGTPQYLSPEVFLNSPYAYYSDIWSLGCLLYEMCSLKKPFDSSNVMTLANKIINDPVPKIPKIFSNNLNFVVYFDVLPQREDFSIEENTENEYQEDFEVSSEENNQNEQKDPFMLTKIEEITGEFSIGES